MNVEVNLLAVLLAAVASMVVGFVWYAKPVFGNAWIKLAKVNEKKISEGSARAIGLAFVAALVTAYILAHVAYLSNSFFHNSFLNDALTTAFWLWLGFSAARIVMGDAFEQRPGKLSAINAGHDLVSLLAMALVIGIIGN
jgi:hypothetical protein